LRDGRPRRGFDDAAESGAEVAEHAIEAEDRLSLV
jgi:hypothetical protein